jgi:hypothetical protein
MVPSYEAHQCDGEYPERAIYDCIAVPEKKSEGEAVATRLDLLGKARLSL